MRWYLAARHLVRVLAGVLLLSGLTVAWAGSPLPVPNLGGGVTLGVPAALLLPAICAVVVTSAFADAGTPLEAVAVRRISALDRAACALLLVVGAATLVAASGTDPLLVGGARNLMGFVGTGLLCRPVLGARAAPVAPLAVALLVGTFGQSLDPAWWFWPLRRAGDPSAAGIAGALAFAGLLLGLRVRRPG